MGYFEGITASYFKTDKEGNTVFYPYGILGKGYILPEERKVLFRRLIKKYMQISLPLAIATTMFLKWWLVLLFVFPFYLLAYAIWMNKLTKNFKKSTDKLTLSESTTNSARSHNLTTLWLLEIGSLLFVIVGIFIVITSPKDWYRGILSIAFFGFTGYVGLKMIKAKKKSGKHTTIQSRRQRIATVIF